MILDSSTAFRWDSGYPPVGGHCRFQSVNEVAVGTIVRPVGEVFKSVELKTGQTEVRRGE